MTNSFPFSFIRDSITSQRCFRCQPWLRHNSSISYASKLFSQSTVFFKQCCHGEGGKRKTELKDILQTGTPKHAWPPQVSHIKPRDNVGDSNVQHAACLKRKGISSRDAALPLEHQIRPTGEWVRRHPDVGVLQTASSVTAAAPEHYSQSMWVYSSTGLRLVRLLISFQV